MSAVPQSDQSVLLREDHDGVAWLTMNRAQQLNLLTGAMLDALQQAFDAIADDARVRVVVLAGAGKGFARATTSKKSARSKSSRRSGNCSKSAAASCCRSRSCRSR